MNVKKNFRCETIAAMHWDRILGIRAGTGTDHRLNGILDDVIERRAFVRSWSMISRSWWWKFLEDPNGTLVAGEKEIPGRAIQTRNERLKDLVNAAYNEKYNKPGNIQYVRGLSGEKSLDTSMELILMAGENRND